MCVIIYIFTFTLHFLLLFHFIYTKLEIFIYFFCISLKIAIYFRLFFFLWHRLQYMCIYDIFINNIFIRCHSINVAKIESIRVDRQIWASNKQINCSTACLKNLETILTKRLNWLNKISASGTFLRHFVEQFIYKNNILHWLFAQNRLA